MEISNLPIMSYKKKGHKDAHQTRIRMGEHSEIFSKEIENTKFPNKGYRAEEDNNSLKITLEGFNRRLDKTGERICELESKAVEHTQTAAKRKRILKSEDTSRDLWDNIN